MNNLTGGFCKKKKVIMPISHKWFHKIKVEGTLPTQSDSSLTLNPKPISYSKKTKLQTTFQDEHRNKNP